MVLAMIFGGHLLPFGWLYKSKSYMYSSVIVTISVLIIGCTCAPDIIALFMLLYEIVFTGCLFIENKKNLCKKRKVNKRPLFYQIPVLLV